MIEPILAQQNAIVIDDMKQPYSNYFNFRGKQQMTLLVHTNSDRDDANDVKAVIDGLIYNAVGAMPQSSILVITTAGDPYAALPSGDTPPPPPPASFDLAQFLSDNWIWIALGLGAAVVAEDVL